MRAITVENISKKYRIGESQNAKRNLRETLSQSVVAPFKRIGKLLRGQPYAATASKESIWALNNVSFEVEHGEAVGIIGNNGAGKSTLLKILSRITDPTSGQALIHGRIGSLLEVGTGFHPELSGRENIFLNGAILGMRRQEIVRKFDEIVAFAEIEKFLDTPVKHYSSGMYIRLAFSVAAHLEPEILVVDEVLAVGDIRFQKKCLGKMGDVAKSGRTVLFVSHNMPAVRSLCTRAMLIDQGVIKQDGAVDDVLNTYIGSHVNTQIGNKYFKEGKRPGNSSFQMISIEVQNSKKENTDWINISEDFFVKLTYEVLQNNAQACFSLSLMSEDGTCVFSSLNNLENSFYGKPLTKGVYNSQCLIPGNLLNNGHFCINLVGLSSSWSDPFTIDRVVSFEAHDDGVLKGDYHGGYGGYIRPKLKWQSEKNA